MILGPGQARPYRRTTKEKVTTMQFKVNRGWTSVRILRYLENDKGKKHSVVECVGSIPLVPEVPEAIPESVLARMTPAQQDETRTKLDAIRAKRPAFVLERAATEATLALGEVIMAARPGLILQAYAGDGLRTALVEVSNALPDLYPASGTVASSPSKSQDSVGAAIDDFGSVSASPTSVSVPAASALSERQCPVGAALAATNALVDATRAGLQGQPRPSQRVAGTAGPDLQPVRRPARRGCRHHNWRAAIC